MKAQQLMPEFVELMPEVLAEGILYVSIPYRTSVHLCACGCRNKVVLPLSPAEWRLVYDGESISLYPSVGNWEFPCQAHYWIRESQVSWATAWNTEQITAGRRRDVDDLDSYLAGQPRAPKPRAPTGFANPRWKRVSGWLDRLMNRVGE